MTTDAYMLGQTWKLLSIGFNIHNGLERRGSEQGKGKAVEYWEERRKKKMKISDLGEREPI